MNNNPSKSLIVDKTGNLHEVIVCIVKVNRTRSAKEALRATNRYLHLRNRVVAKMPSGIGEETEVVFFKLGRYGYMSYEDLDKEYELRGLIPVDPFSLAAVNEDEPTFTKMCGNHTHWKDGTGKWCCAYFGDWSALGMSDRRAYVLHADGCNVQSYKFAGIRKSIELLCSAA